MARYKHTDNESAKMATSKGVIQGYTGVAAVDSKHQIIVDAQAQGVMGSCKATFPVCTSEQRLSLNVCSDP